jgi:putative transcriptional regulator
MAPRNNLIKARGDQTQAEIAQRAGIARAFYAQIEAGARTPSLNVAKRIADALDGTIDDLFFGGAEVANRNIEPDDASLTSLQEVPTNG